MDASTDRIVVNIVTLLRFFISLIFLHCPFSGKSQSEVSKKALFVRASRSLTGCPAERGSGEALWETPTGPSAEATLPAAHKQCQ